MFVSEVAGHVRVRVWSFLNGACSCLLLSDTLGFCTILGPLFGLFLVSKSQFMSIFHIFLSILVF